MSLNLKYSYLPTFNNRVTISDIRIDVSENFALSTHVIVYPAQQIP